YGRTLADDPRRCEAMLKDLCGAQRREIAVLIAALRERVASDLLTTNAHQHPSLLMTRLTQRLIDDLALQPEAARWAVESWALALGVIDGPLVVAPLETTRTPPQAKQHPVVPKKPGPPRSTNQHPVSERKEQTPPPPTPLGAPDVHGWPADRVQALQRYAAKSLGFPVFFRDPDFRERLRQRIKTGKQRRWFRSPEPIYEEMEVVTSVAPPQMVVIPAGSFLMGADEENWHRERPQHRVSFARPFALGCYAVTFDDYDAFCAATGRDQPDDEGWGRGRQPVINVSWGDAMAYCQWLSQRTGSTYRLPSEAEWEYACRAGTTTWFHFGDAIAQDQVNGNFFFSASATGMSTKQRAFVSRPVPVGTFAPNAWGLYEMHGNVWE
ncbi:MAG: hypothetical protein EOM10_16585, partial [Opitutae bacterium]|nr:hypothetical protein [Opitutae bacterium]